MKRRYLVLIPIWIVVALALAFPLREAVVQTIVMPISYLLWMLGLLYRAIPQPVVWILFIAVMLFAAASLVMQNVSLTRGKPFQRIAVRGPVSEMALNISRKGRGVYFRWQVARALSELALELQQLRTHDSARMLDLDETATPEVVRRYLVAGLNTSFSDYPLPGPFQPPQKTPFDTDLNQVIDYLESQTEMDDDFRNS